MGLDLKSTNAKLVVGGAIVLIVVLLLWPKFRGSSNKYEDDYLENEMFEDEDEEEGFEDEDEYGDETEGYAEQWRFADEGFEDGEEEYDEGFGPLDNSFGTLAPLAAAQKAIASSRPDLPGVNVATDLLPKPALSQTDFAEFAPSALGAQNFVDATAFVGVNTQGSALKNANYQLRADIPIPRVDVGPWANSTIESGDLARRPLE
jgi:hypothetical protein